MAGEKRKGQQPLEPLWCACLAEQHGGGAATASARRRGVQARRSRQLRRTVGKWKAHAERRAAARSPPPPFYFHSRDEGPHAGTPHVLPRPKLWSCRSGAQSNARPCALASALVNTRGSSPPHHPGPRCGGLSPPLDPVKLRVVESRQATVDRAGADHGAALGVEVVGPPQRVERHPPPKLPPPALMIQRERAAVPRAALRSRNGACWKDGPPRTPPHTPGPPNGAPAGVVRVPRHVLASTQKICSFWTVVVREEDRRWAPQAGGGEAGRSRPGRSTRAPERLSVR